MLLTRDPENSAHAKGWAEARREDAELTRAEQALAQKEAELEAREESAHAELATLQADRKAIESLLGQLLEKGVQEATRILHNLPLQTPPPGLVEKKRALDARRQALQARKEAADGRDRVLNLLHASVTAARQGLAQARQDAKETEQQHLQQQALRKEAERKEAERLEAQRQEAARREAERLRAQSTSSQPPPHRAPGHVAHASSSHGEDRRQVPRKRLDCHVDMESETNFYAGFGWDISSGGLFVATFEPIPTGSKIDIAFTLPSGARVETRAVVRWVREVEGANVSALPGVGLQFLRLTEEQEQVIHAFMQARSPMFYD